ncbi:hypothetical protein AGMMS50267_00100 [Spirochaetia bacterium]|nr:hypothetical protein AGMMS50267_00100 [Spirochaetia bacterium]
MLLLAGASGQLFAREVTVTVHDAGLGIPLEGAVIHSPEARQYTCDEAGSAVVIAPDDRAVVLRITYPGYKIARLVITVAEDHFSVSLLLEDILENAELIVEAQAPNGAVSGQTGRSAALAGERLRRAAEIGIFEDVMSAVKLLPGVGYTGMFDVKPSIRGGEPGDLTAVFDGFYVENPYHWDGVLSIFDPGMVDSAKLSHGVFSARYGHSISGLLEVASKKPDPNNAELEAGFSTSSLKARLSIPFNGKGGIQAAGNGVTLQPVVSAAKLVTDRVDFFSIAPYLLNSMVSGNYRFNNDLELNLSGFAGLDGVGTDFSGDVFNFSFSQGFITTGALWNPAPNMIFRGRLGAGFSRDQFEGNYEIEYRDMLDEKTGTYQARIDFDWDIGNKLIAIFGTEERYSHYTQSLNHSTYNKYYWIDSSISNRTSFLSTWAALEYNNPEQNLGGELGLRLDHLYGTGNNFTTQTMPVFSPRLNADYTILKDSGPVDTLSVTAGTGLFAGIPHNGTDDFIRINEDSPVHDYDLKMIKSWTSITGLTIDFMEQYRGTLEFYYKYIFDRRYTKKLQDDEYQYFFDGEGRSFGIELMLQKSSGRFFDGWLTYSFNWVQYRDPSYGPGRVRTAWYYPEFHRFHNLNVIGNINITPKTTVTVHAGYVSGAPIDIGADRGDREITLDLKFLWRWHSRGRKTLGEFYAAVENIWSLFEYDSLEEYAQKIADGEVTFQLPIPVPSIGFRLSY